MNTRSDQNVQDYRRIESAIRYLEQNFKLQPTLEELARNIHVSEFHLQRIFRRWAGISPKRFLQVLTVNHCKQLLAQSKSVLDSALDSGLSGPGRMHDLFVTLEAVSPGEFKKKGEGLSLTYGFHATPFGICLIASTPRGICELTFPSDVPEQALTALQEKWPNARLNEDNAGSGGLIDRIFYGRGESSRPLRIHTRATNFEAKVWTAMLRIPAGAAISYEELARFTGCEKASRAVGSAVARNSVGFLIPCHRVIRKTGVIGDYRWGSTRKKAILAWEALRV